MTPTLHRIYWFHLSPCMCVAGLVAVVTVFLTSLPLFTAKKHWHCSSAEARNSGRPVKAGRDVTWFYVQHDWSSVWTWWNVHPVTALLSWNLRSEDVRDGYAIWKEKQLLKAKEETNAYGSEQGGKRKHVGSICNLPWAVEEKGGELPWHTLNAVGVPCGKKVSGLWLQKKVYSSCILPVLTSRAEFFHYDEMTDFSIL